MSFVLPGNARSLRFTGEAKALAPNSAPGSAHAPGSVQPGMQTAMTTLGKPRVRKTTTTPPNAFTTSPGGSPDQRRILTPHGATQLTAPSPGTIVPNASHGPRSHRIGTPVPQSGRDGYGPRSERADLVGTPYMTASHAPLMRNKFDSMSDDVTMALEREDVLPGAVRPHKPIVVPNAPAIPHFRAQAADPPTAIIPQVAQVDPERRGAPYAVWIAASILAGLISFHVAPAIMGIFTTHAQAQSMDP